MRYLISIVGPTGIGKTKFSVYLAKRFKTSVVSADSRQVYQELNIGTAKPRAEELENVPHYLLDEVPPNQRFSAGMYRRQALKALDEIYSKGFIAIMAGGSGLYLQAIWEGFDDIPDIDPETRLQVELDFEKKGLDFLLGELKQVDEPTFATIDQSNPHRVMRSIEVFRGTGHPVSYYRQGKKQKPDFEVIKVGLTMDREKLYERIEKRVDVMMESGLENEVKALKEKYGTDIPAFQTVGYKEFIPYFNSEYGLEEVIRLIKRNTRRFAKRQYTWFRRYDDINWFEADQYGEAEAYILSKVGVE